MKEDIAGLVISGFIFLLLLTISLVLRSGKGSFLISGYNMLSKEEKAKYNTKALCRFVGNMLLFIDFLVAFSILSAIFEITWLSITLTFVIFGFTIICLIYANTKNRFKR